jgi:hypothetical protein
MALKGVIDNLEAVDEGLREHYVSHTDGKFYLATDKGDIGGLLRAKEHEKTLRSAAEAKLTPLEEQVTSLTTARDAAITERDAARSKKSGMDDTLEQSYKDKVAAAEQKALDTEAALTGEINRLLVSDRALLLATEISTVPELLAPVIEARLAAEKGGDGKFFVRVLDADKKPSATSLDELKQELLANEKYSTIMVAGKGSGSGASDSGDKGGAQSKKGFWEHSDDELTKLRNEQPEEFERLKREAQPAR